MTIKIETDNSLSPENTTVTINGIKYKEFKGLQLKLSKNLQGELTIEHETGYIESYKAEVKENV
jgi:hypothetical protein